jgi:hypothetical protein
MTDVPAAPPDWLGRLLVPAAESKGWLKFLSVVLFAVGVLSALSIVGIVVAWLYIWVGVLLWQAAERVGRAQAQRDPRMLEEYLKKLRTLIVISGVVTVVHLAAAVLCVAMLGWLIALLPSWR